MALLDAGTVPGTILIQWYPPAPYSCCPTCPHPEYHSGSNGCSPLKTFNFFSLVNRDADEKGTRGSLLALGIASKHVISLKFNLNVQESNFWAESALCRVQSRVEKNLEYNHVGQSVAWVHHLLEETWISVASWWSTETSCSWQIVPPDKISFQFQTGQCVACWGDLEEWWIHSQWIYLD